MIPALADKKVEPEEKSGCFNGINFFISGYIPDLRLDSCIDLIEKCGGKVMSSLSEETNVVISGLSNFITYETQLQKAKDLNVQIIDVYDLLYNYHVETSDPIPDDLNEVEEFIFHLFYTLFPTKSFSFPKTHDNSHNITDNNIINADENDKNNENNENDNLDLLSITNQENLSDLLHLQELLYSETIETNSLQSFLEELEKKYSIKDIDHQIILAFSLDYSRIPILLPFLSKKRMEKNDFIHADQEFIYQLIEAKVSFPLIIIWEKCMEFIKFQDNDFEPINPDGGDEPWEHCDIGAQELLFHHPPNLYIEEKLRKKLQQQIFINDLNESFDIFDLKYERIIKDYEDFAEWMKDDNYLALFHNHHQHKDDEIIDIIDHDDLERLRILTSIEDFNFNYQIDKENLLYEYSSIPIISYSIEKNAMKCFKYLLINENFEAIKLLLENSDIIKSDMLYLDTYIPFIDNLLERYNDMIIMLDDRECQKKKKIKTLDHI